MGKEGAGEGGEREQGRGGVSGSEPLQSWQP